MTPEDIFFPSPILPTLRRDLRADNHTKKINDNHNKQAGTELCQAQVNLYWPEDGVSSLRLTLKVFINVCQLGFDTQSKVTSNY